MHARALTTRRLLVGLVAGLLTAAGGAAIGAMADSLPSALRSWQVLAGISVVAIAVAVVLQVERSTARGLRRVAAVSHGGGVVEVIAVTADGAVVAATYTEDGTWSEWADLAAVGETVDVTALVRVEDSVEYFAVDGHGVLRTMRRGRDRTTSWLPVGGNVPGGRLRRIASMSYSADHREVFGITDAGRGVHMWSNGEGDWSAWHDMLSPAGRDVAACSTRPELIECFVVDRDGDVWHRWWLERWVDWYSWGREKHAAVAVAALRSTNETQEMLVADSIGRLAHRWHKVHESWSRWEPMPAPERMVDVAGAVTSGWKPNYFTVDREGQLWQRSYDDGWGPWRTVPVGRATGQRRQEVR